MTEKEKEELIFDLYMAQDEVESLREELDDHDNTIDKLVEVLKFYADPKNYTPKGIDGELARTAIQKLEEGDL